METKKSPKADLERKRILFLEIGMVVALLLVLLAFEWTKQDVSFASLGELPELTGDDEIIPITRLEQEKPIEPPKPEPVVLELNIVDDEVDTDNEFQIVDFEASQDEEIAVIPVEEEIDDAPAFFIIVEDMPTFQGGTVEDFRKYIEKTISYPQLAIENNISGTVHVQFIVNAQGGYSSINIQRGVDPSLDQAVIGAIKKAPKWKAGQQRGKPVPVMMSIPIRFVLN